MKRDFMTINDAKLALAMVVDLVDEVAAIWPGFSASTACVFSGDRTYAVVVGDLPLNVIKVHLARTERGVPGGSWATAVTLTGVHGAVEADMRAMVTTVAHEVEVNAVGL